MNLICVQQFGLNKLKNKKKTKIISLINFGDFFCRESRRMTKNCENR